jgi:hypothetical protein
MYLVRHATEMALQLSLKNESFDWAENVEELYVSNIYPRCGMVMDANQILCNSCHDLAFCYRFLYCYRIKSRRHFYPIPVGGILRIIGSYRIAL